MNSAIETSSLPVGWRRVELKDFANILISVPFLLEQRAIAEYLNTAEQETSILRQRAEQYRGQKRGLMQKLLTGKLKTRL